MCFWDDSFIEKPSAPMRVGVFNESFREHDDVSGVGKGYISGYPESVAGECRQAMSFAAGILKRMCKLN